MDYFKRADSGDRLCCNQCPKSYPTKTSQSSYASLWYHLKSKHGIERPVSNDVTPPPAKRNKTQSSLLSFSAEGKKSQSMVYAELAAVDRFSFNQISKSNFVRSSMQQKYNVAHTSHNTIRAKVKEFWQAAKAETVAELKKMKQAGQRFALTFDEWTGANKRYLTVNVHFSGADFINLGMIRVWSSQKAETLLKLVTIRLQEFELNWNDVVAITTDGASIMLKLGRLVDCEHIVCLSHTLHLVVGDVLYEKKKKKGKDTDEETQDDPASDDIDDEAEEEAGLDLATDEELEIEDQDTDDSDESLPASLSGI